MNSILRSFRIALLAALMIQCAGGQTLAPAPQQSAQGTQDKDRSVHPELADPRVITYASITNLVSKFDTTAMNADVDAYAKMLADDFTVTITSDVNPDQGPRHQSKADYVRDMREAVKSCRVLGAKTTIDEAIITDPSARAVVYCTLAERTQVSGKRICNVTVHQKFNLELRQEGVKITKLEFQIAEAKWE